jgi:peptidoglycan hydrolase-like protein with peptidoglycan-binding domain
MFRSISRPYHAQGISWWDWQSARPVDFKAIAAPTGRLSGFVADTTAAGIGRGAIGDLVVWAQEHLVSSGARISIDGDYGPATQSAVASFQAQHGLSVTGAIDPPTWASLLRYPPAKVRWVRRGKKGQYATTARTGGSRVTPVPRSARAPERRDEVAGAGGAGYPRHR